MERTKSNICLLAVFSLLLSAIWPNSVRETSAATVPVIAPLGQITEGLAVPTRLDVDSAGNLYVLDYDKKSVIQFDKYGKLGRVYPVPAAGGTGIAVSPGGERIYVSCGHTVQILNASTGVVEGSLGVGDDAFSDAGEIDLDVSGYVYVADLDTKVVKVFDDTDAFVFSFGGFGILDGQFWGISGLSVDTNAGPAGEVGQVYVADSFVRGTRLPMLQVFGLDGALLKKILANTDFGSIPLGTFTGITFDGVGRAYVLDFFRSDIRVVDTAAGFLSRYVQDGLLMSPKDIVFDPATGRLFVSCGGGRIGIFGVDGAANPVAVVNEAPGKPTLLTPVAGGEVALASPVMTFGNAVDPDGDLLVYDLEILDGQGAPVAAYTAQAEGVDVTEVALAAPLAENQLFSWRARSFDGAVSSGWTESQTFYVNALDEPPSSPVLISPVGGDPFDGDGLLIWSASVDPDPFDRVEYKVEIATDREFAEVVAVQAASDLEIVFESLADYGSLVDGTPYFWRVIAVDSDGLESVSAEVGNFVFDTTLLKVACNMPGARVYLGGNLGYAGRFLGKAPFELRRFPVGRSTLVVERAGFEPSVVQIEVSDRQNAEVYVALAPALTPEDFGSKALSPGNKTTGSAPFLVDFDQDGLLDLLVGNIDGSVELSLAESVDGEVSFSSPYPLLSQVIPAAVPFVVDWNNDGTQDLLVGSGDGTVSLFVNAGSSSAPNFSVGAYLQVGGANLVVGSHAVPVVTDFDADGDKDLLVGSGAGAVVLLRNIGTDAAPQFQSAEELLVGFSAATAPFVADWDGDGLGDLLVLSAGRLYRGDRQADGTYAAVPLLTIAADQSATADLGGGKVAKDQGHKELAPSGDLRFFVADMDGEKGKDLVVGLETGELRLLASKGKTLVPAFNQALLDKVEQIRLAADNAAPIADALSALNLAIGSGNLVQAALDAELLAAAVAGQQPLTVLVAELGSLLVLVTGL
jgi:hypothetical protein